LFVGGTMATRGECQRLTVARPSQRNLRRGSAQPSTATLVACLDLVRTALMQPATAVPESAASKQAASSDRRLGQLLGTYRAVEQLEPWVVWSDKSQPGSFLTLELASLKAAALAALAAERVVGPKHGVVIDAGRAIVDHEGTRALRELRRQSHG